MFSLKNDKKEIAMRLDNNWHLEENAKHAQLSMQAANVWAHEPHIFTFPAPSPVIRQGSSSSAAALALFGEHDEPLSP